MWIYLLMLLAGAFGLAFGIIKAKRTGNKAWYILTASGAVLAAAAIALILAVFILLGAVALQSDDTAAAQTTAQSGNIPPSEQTEDASYPYEMHGKDALNAAQIALYDEMYPKIAALEPFSYDAASYGCDTLDDVFVAWGGISQDYPEIDNYFTIYEVNGDESIVVSLDAKYMCSWDGDRSDDIAAVRAGIEEFEAAASAIISGLNDGMSTYEKYLYLAKAVSERTDYDYESESAASAAPWCSIVGGLSICQGYSEAFQYLCRRADLWCAVVTGESGDASHAWNLIKLQSGTYHVDITWADEQGTPGGSEWMRYFKLTQSEIEQDHIVTDGTVATGQ